MNNSLKQQAEEIMKTAKDYGLEQNFFFTTTFEKYLTQLEILEKIKSELPQDDEEFTKAMQYTKIVDSSNKTLSSLIRLITTMRNGRGKRTSDPLLDFLSGKKQVPK
jgi:tRNA nucleotidyltransferase/poly(A) polymerase